MKQRVEWYTCIHCGLLDDYNDSQVCRDCMELIASNAENLFLIDLLREACAELDDSPLKRKIERILAVSKRTAFDENLYHNKTDNNLA